jgi:Protein of unknown function (DUF1194)
MSFRGWAFIAAVGSGGFAAFGAVASCPDLALVLAIDGSGSISSQDYGLQQAGYVTAFGDPEVRAALAGAGVVDVAAVVWGDAEMSPQVLPWRRIRAPEDAVRLAADLAGMPRQVTGDTGIGRGIWTALDLIAADRTCAARRIINVSGDGRESVGPQRHQHIPLVVARDRADAMGVTINGLAITVEETDLADWYRSRVIVGPGAFVITANSFEVFGDAIIRKLVREIALPTVAAAETPKEEMP